MQKLKSFTFVILFGIAALGLTTSPAKALVIYSYTGNNYNVIVNDVLPVEIYDTTMSVTGSFTVAAPLLSLPATNITALVLNYSFSDGVQTRDETNSTLSAFNISTDGSGALLHWIISIQEEFPTPTSNGDTSGQILLAGGLFNVDDFVQSNTCIAIDTTDFSCFNFLFDSASSDGPGSFVFRTATVPEPSTLLLFGVGLAGLAGFARRRHQA